MADAGEGATCSICCDSVLSQPAAALRCGHVYHAHCIQCWIAQSKGICPQCKRITRAQDLRHLDFEVIEVLPESLEEVRRLIAASSPEMERQLEELNSERAQLVAEDRSICEELAQRQREAQECKRARRDMERLWPQNEAELDGLKQKANHARLECAEMQAHLDKEEARHFRKLPIAQARDEDADLKEEKRKLRSVRPADRARILHDALVSAREQEADCNKVSQEREDAAKKVEQDLKKIKQEESKLRRELQVLKEDAENVVTSSQRSSQRSALRVASQEAGVGRSAGRSAASAEAKRTTRAVGAETREDEDLAEDALLLSGPLLRRKASSGLLLGGCSSGGSSGGLLAKSAMGARASAVSSVGTPVRNATTLRSIFSKR